MLALLILIVIPSVSLLDGAKDAVQERLASYTVTNDAQAVGEALERIPASASVAAPNYALPALASREKLYYLTYLSMYPQARPDYVLVDRNVERVTSNPELQRRYAAIVRDLTDSPQYAPVWHAGPYLLLQRQTGNAGALSTAAEGPRG
jgi:hypothetical protein